MTDYQLDSLGTREFEHLTQALTLKSIGPALTIFGDGPDGGREATWDGAVTLPPLATWDGYGVLQAKYQARVGTPSENLAWFRDQLHAELDAWAAPDSKRIRKPDYFLIVTNTRLSGVPEKGKDAARKLIQEKISALGLPIRAFHIWDSDSLRALLDDASDVRRRYAAFLTAGDVISQILDAHDASQKRLSAAISSATASSLAEESPLNLTQAGVMSESGTTVSQVFVDLPFAPTNPIKRESLLHGRFRPANNSSVMDLVDDETIPFGSTVLSFPSERKTPGIAAGLIDRLNSTRDPSSDDGVDDRSVVLVGGPGQGKSTVTQWLAQVYRSTFLAGSPTLKNNRATGRYAAAVEKRAKEISMPPVSARRWPYRIVLTELADYLALNPNHSVLEYLSHDISARSTSKVDAEDLLSWAGSYPWVIFVDGLDEVPPSSNRSTVLSAISRMTVELDTAGADVVVVATTRPQGYGDELASYTHLWLAPLSTNTALACAEVLVSARHGSGTKKAKQVMDRLRRASREQSTSRLFKSPLQVTILTVLLEKLGKAPGDRSRLFSAYYDVISSREQEKSGDLSDLLQRYEADILSLHRQIGFLLQDRASSAGETSATLSREEFYDLIRAQFMSTGHGETETESLVNEFARLVTDRLVFLAYVVGDRIGFEIRSLQEYMAGEYIVSLPQTDVIPALREIAASSYWRNVTLFAFGSIFARVEHLRAEAVLLCSELNQREPQGVLFFGSELALEVLRDGSCLSMPIYSDHLARIASEILGGPITTEARKLARVGDPRVQAIIDNAANSMDAARPAAWLNRLLYVSALSGPHSQHAERLTKMLAHAPVDAQRLAVRYAWNDGHEGLDPVIDAAWMETAPSTFFSNAGARQVDELGEHAPDSVRSLTTLSQVLNEPPFDHDEFLALWGTWVPLDQDREEWQWLEDACSVPHLPRDWGWARPLAAFALAPSSEALALLLEAVSRANATSRDIPARAPWVVTKHIREAEYRALVSNDPSVTLRSELAAMAADARAGRLGDTDVWHVAEASTESPFTATREVLEKWPQHVAEHAVPLSAMLFAARSTLQDDQYATPLEVADALIELASRLTEGPDRVAACELALFELGILATSGYKPLSPDNTAQYAKWASDALLSNGVDSSWWPWWAEEGGSAESPSPSQAVLIRLGEAEQLHRQPDEATARRILKIHRADRSLWQLLRLALTAYPPLVVELEEEDLASLLGVADDPRAATMASCLRAGLAVADGGSLSIPAQVPHLDSRFSVQWLVQVGQLPAARMELLAEIGAELASQDPAGSSLLVAHARSQLLSDKPILTFAPRK